MVVCAKRWQPIISINVVSIYVAICSPQATSNFIYTSKFLYIHASNYIYTHKPHKVFITKLIN